MKIAIIEPIGGHGGMNYYDFSLAGGLVNSGGDVTVYTCDKTEVVEGLSFKVKRYFKRIWGDEPRVLRGSRYFFCLLKTLFDAWYHGIDIVHYHFFHYTVMELTSVAFSRMFGFNIFITVHDVESLAGRYSPITACRILDMADKIIVHNQVSRKELLCKTTLSTEKITIIPHGNYLNNISQRLTSDEARKKLNLCTADPVLLFFGQIKELKGLDVLLNSLPAVIGKFPRLKLLVAGKVWNDNFSNYMRIIEEKRLLSYIDLYVKYIPDKDVSTYYCAADIVILPYRKIYQSGVLLMAMSYGVPTIVSDLAGMIEIVEDGLNGYVFKEGDAVDLSNKLINALSDREQTKQISKVAFRLMQQHYDWNGIGRKTLSLYQKSV